jgi:hypothetical protein
VLIVDGIDKKHLRRWSLFLRQLMAESTEDAVVGPIPFFFLPG